jgi:hypothetical protein
MSQRLTVECTIHFQRRGHGARRQIVAAPAPPQPSPGRVPRISRLMALALRFEQLIHAGHVVDYADLARLGHVTRARLTQIMNLLLLAPDIKEEILFLPRVAQGRDPIHLGQLQSIALTADWREQRRLWRELQNTVARESATVVAT